jgi:hypothetical protein
VRCLSLGRGRCNGSHVAADISAGARPESRPLGEPGIPLRLRAGRAPLTAWNGPDSLFDKPRSERPNRRGSRAGRKDGRHPRAALSYLRLPLLVLPISATGRLEHLSRGGGDMCRKKGTRRGPLPSGRRASRATPRSYASSRTLVPKLSVLRGGRDRTALGSIGSTPESLCSATTFIGTVTGALGGDPFSSSVITTVTSAPQPAGGSGVLFATTSHTIALPTGTVTTSDSARLIPTGQPGLFRIVTHVTVVGGGSGQMVFNGSVDLVGGSTQFQIHGAVCGG